MAEVLVVVDHVDGAVRKPTLELLTLARRIGEPSAVFLGKGVENAQAVLEYIVKQVVDNPDEVTVSTTAGRLVSVPAAAP